MSTFLVHDKEILAIKENPQQSPLSGESGVAIPISSIKCRVKGEIS